MEQSVRAEIERLIGDMQKAAKASGQPDMERMTTDIEALVMVNSIPDTTDPKIINCYAQTAVIRAWRQYAEAVLAQTR